jgi:hypothetical protein
MKSDFAAVRALLELARAELRGADPTSDKLRQAIDLLTEVVAAAELRKPNAKIIPFPATEANATS